MKKVIFNLVALGFFIIGGLLQAGDSTFKVIMNASNPQSSMTKDQISKLFLKKTTKWDTGTKVLPVDLGEKSPVRESFSKSIHGKGIGAIQAYWQKLIFAGRGVPPAIKASDGEVVDFVKANARAIGYVSGKTSIAGVKVLKIRE